MTSIQSVTCTCGIWVCAPSDSPDQLDHCPRCGAERLANRSALDFAAAPWEELYVRGRRFGVFFADGESPDPIVVFQTETDCDEWITWQRSRGDDSRIGSLDICVMGIDGLSGIAWNDLGSPPPVGSPWPPPNSRDPRSIDETTERVAASMAYGSGMVARVALLAIPIVGFLPLTAATIVAPAGTYPAWMWVAVLIYVLCSLAAIWLIQEVHRKVNRR